MLHARLQYYESFSNKGLQNNSMCFQNIHMFDIVALKNKTFLSIVKGNIHLNYILYIDTSNLKFK